MRGHRTLHTTSVRHGTDGIARIKNILKYYILMSVVLYISNDKIINYGHKCTYILLTMLITDQYNELAAFYCIKNSRSYKY